MDCLLLLTVLKVAGQPPLYLWYSKQRKYILIIVLPLVEFMTSSRFVGAVWTSAAAAGVLSWVGISPKLCAVEEMGGRFSSSSVSLGGSALDAKH